MWGCERREKKKERKKKREEENKENNKRKEKKKRSMRVEKGFEKKELEIEIKEEINKMKVSIEFCKELKKKNEKIERKIRIGIIDRLVMEENKEKIGGNLKGKILKIRIGKKLVGVEGKWRSGMKGECWDDKKGKEKIIIFNEKD